MIKLIDEAPTEEVEVEQPASTWKDKIFERAKEGEVIPIIGNVYMNALLFDEYDALIKYYASRMGIAPQIDDPQHADDWHRRQVLSALTQFQIAAADSVVTVKQDYLKVLKDGLRGAVNSDQIEISSDKKAELNQIFDSLSVSKLCKFVNYPDLTDRRHPLRRLAALSLPIFITTSYHDLLERALREHGKDPVVGVCKWNDYLEFTPIFEADKDYEPSVDKPLVYHLYGIDSDAVSLVLTEDDHLDFMANVKRALPARLTKALRRSSLIVLGYRLQDLDFKVLFRGIIKEHRTLKMESVAIQLEESDRDRQYLENYLQRQVDFKVEWASDPGDFIRELFQQGRP